jgi:hypothetical protein
LFVFACSLKATDSSSIKTLEQRERPRQLALRGSVSGEVELGDLAFEVDDGDVVEELVEQVADGVSGNLGIDGGDVHSHVDRLGVPLAICKPDFLAAGEGLESVEELVAVLGEEVELPVVIVGAPADLVAHLGAQRAEALEQVGRDVAGRDVALGGNELVHVFS